MGNRFGRIWWLNIYRAIIRPFRVWKTPKGLVREWQHLFRNDKPKDESELEGLTFGGLEDPKESERFLAL
jgi:hypothetical protein